MAKFYLRMNTIEIRLAKKEDAKFIALLGRTTFTETFGHFFRDQKDLIDYYNLTFSVQKIEDGIKKPNNIFWIAFVNRLPVGYAKLKLNSNSEFIESKDVCQTENLRFERLSVNENWIWITRSFIKKSQDQTRYRINLKRKFKEGIEF